MVVAENAGRRGERTVDGGGRILLRLVERCDRRQALEWLEMAESMRPGGAERQRCQLATGARTGQIDLLEALDIAAPDPQQVLEMRLGEIDGATAAGPRVELWAAELAAAQLLGVVNRPSNRLRVAAQHGLLNGESGLGRAIVPAARGLGFGGG